MTVISVPATKGRVHWIDLLRGAAVISVIVMHAAIVVPFEDVPAPFLWFASATGAYRMPALMFCSGLLLPLALRKTPGPYMSGKLLKLLWPWLLWSLVMFSLIDGANPADPAWWMNYHGKMHTWFLLVVFVAYVLALPLRRVNPFFVAAALFAVSWMLPHEPAALWFLERVLRMSAYFFVGAGVAANPELVSRLPWQVGALMASVTAGWSIYAVRSGGVDEETPLGSLLTLIGVLAAAWILARVPRSTATAWMEWFGRRSLVPYLVHWPLFYLMVELFGTDSGGVIISAMILAALAMSALVIWLWPATRWAFELPPIGGRDRPRARA